MEDDAKYFRLTPFVLEILESTNPSFCAWLTTHQIPKEEVPRIISVWDGAPKPMSNSTITTACSDAPVHVNLEEKA